MSTRTPKQSLDKALAFVEPGQWMILKEPIGVSHGLPVASYVAQTR